MSIESHYNALRIARTNARAALDILDAAVAGDCLRAGHADVRAAVRDRLCERATALSVWGWAATRQAYAKSGDAMPEAPLSFGASGYQVSFGYLGVHASRLSRNDSHELSVLSQAAETLRLDLVRERGAADEAFEIYRRAVEQGVAIAPQG